MKITKEQQEFIKHIHSSSGVWDKDIETKFPKLFKKEDKLTGWYKDKEEKEWCVFLENGIMKHGFNIDGKWFEGLNKTYKLLTYDYKATDKEVKEALTKEAKRLGFKKGVTVISAHSGQKFVIDSKCYFEFNKNYFDNELYVTCDNETYAVLMKEGKWATIVETITKEEAEKQLGKIIE